MKVLIALAFCVGIAAAAEPECADCDCDNCKCRLSEAGKGCQTAGMYNSCPEAKAHDESLCKPMDANTSTDPLFACRYPTILTGVTSAKATSVETAFTMTPSEWTFMQLEVPMGTEMHNIQYELKIPQSKPNVTAAFLVGRCLKEVECGDCPPRCETLMSTDRQPQFCTLPEYCPGCTEDGCREYADIAGTDQKAYTGAWSNLKACQKEKAKFYIGVFGMKMPDDAAFDDGNDVVGANLTVWWDGQSGAAIQIPSLLLLLGVAFAQLL